MASLRHNFTKALITTSRFLSVSLRKPIDLFYVSPAENQDELDDSSSTCSPPKRVYGRSRPKLSDIIFEHEDGFPPKEQSRVDNGEKLYTPQSALHKDASPVEEKHQICKGEDSHIGFLPSSPPVPSPGRETTFAQDVDTPSRDGKDESPLYVHDSVSSTASCAVTTHDALCYAPPPWPTMHVRTSPFSKQDQNRESDSGVDTSHLLQPPRSHRLSNPEVKMKHTAEPPVSKAASPFSNFDTKELPLRLKKKSSSKSTATRPGTESHGPDGIATETTCTRVGTQGDAAGSIYDFPLRDLDREFNAARLPAFGEKLSKARYSPRPGSRKIIAKRVVQSRRNVLCETSGNTANQASYSYSQILKGDKRVDELNHVMGTIGGPKAELLTSSQKKGVWRTRENESPSSRVTEDIGGPAGKTTPKEKTMFKMDPTLEAKFQVRHFSMQGITDIPTANSDDSPIDHADQGFNAFPAWEQGEENFGDVLPTWEHVETVGDVYDIQTWDEKMRKAVGARLMKVICDLEQQAGEKVEQ